MAEGLWISTGKQTGTDSYRQWTTKACPTLSCKEILSLNLFIMKTVCFWYRDMMVDLKRGEYIGIFFQSVTKVAQWYCWTTSNSHLSKTATFLLQRTNNPYIYLCLTLTSLEPRAPILRINLWYLFNIYLLYLLLLSMLSDRRKRKIRSYLFLCIQWLSFAEQPTLKLV